MQSLIEQIQKNPAIAKANFNVQLHLMAPTETSKKPARRELWSDEESLKLIELSVQGSTRAHLEQIFKRSTGKIFSKIQKHCVMLTKLKGDLTKGNF